MSNEFPKFPKIPRLETLKWSITEKIDGTNGIVKIVPMLSDDLYTGAVASSVGYAVLAGSRSRWLKPGKTTDNYGFAQYVLENADELVGLLGEGTHYGEWWGAGIQRKYDKTEKRYFSLFSPHRYPYLYEPALNDHQFCVTKVPLLASGEATAELDYCLQQAVHQLDHNGSVASPGFKQPEGVVLTLGHQNYKYILNHGDKSLSRDEA